METKLYKANNKVLKMGGQLLKNGEVVAFPTETVYGLGGNIFNDNAINQIFVVKGRPQDNPLIVHCYHKKQIKEIVKSINPIEQKLIDAFMPGPISIVFDKKDCVSDIVTCGQSTVAVRIPESKLARKFIKCCGVPVAAPSANTSKRPSPTDAQTVFDDMNGKIPLIIDGGKTKVGIESTVVRVENNKVLILRPGKINKEMLEKVTHVEAIENSKTEIKAPGTRYTHYAPNCQMVLVKNDIIENVKNIYNKSIQEGKKPIIFCKKTNVKFYEDMNVFCLGTSSEDASKNLYSALREFEKSFDIIIAEYFDNGSMVSGLYNRMSKSASGNII